MVRQLERENGENIQPSDIFPAFFIVSSVFQIILYLYKIVRSSQNRNIQSYVQILRTNLGKYSAKNSVHLTVCLPVENVLNLYGVLVQIVISGLMCFVVLQHYRDIKEGLYDRSELSLPSEFLYLLLFTTLSTALPFAKSHGLRFKN